MRHLISPLDLSLEEVNDNWEKYVVSFDDIDFWVSKGIKHINVMRLNDVL